MAADRLHIEEGRQSGRIGCPKGTWRRTVRAECKRFGRLSKLNRISGNPERWRTCVIDALYPTNGGRETISENGICLQFAPAEEPFTQSVRAVHFLFIAFFLQLGFNASI